MTLTATRASLPVLLGCLVASLLAALVIAPGAGAVTLTHPAAGASTQDYPVFRWRLGAGEGFVELRIANNRRVLVDGRFPTDNVVATEDGTRITTVRQASSRLPAGRHWWQVRYDPDTDDPDAEHRFTAPRSFTVRTRMGSPRLNLEYYHGLRNVELQVMWLSSSPNNRIDCRLVRERPRRGQRRVVFHERTRVQDIFGEDYFGIDLPLGRSGTTRSRSLFREIPPGTKPYFHLCDAFLRGRTRRREPLRAIIRVQSGDQVRMVTRRLPSP